MQPGPDAVHCDGRRQGPGLTRVEPLGTGQLAMITAPVLVLRGARDRANASPSAQVAAGISHAELRVIPGAHHLWNLEQPELFSRTVDDFVRKVTGGA